MMSITDAIYEKFPRIYNISKMQLQRFKDKVCLITASATGIGLATAERFAQEGAIVYVNSRKESNVNPAVEKIKKAGGRAVAAVGNIVDKKAREAIL
jgi:NAD(P)-dependent dehydrogenase (short-subunit alcohol dehydrogenase family)